MLTSAIAKINTRNGLLLYYSLWLSLLVLEMRYKILQTLSPGHIQLLYYAVFDQKLAYIG